MRVKVFSISEVRIELRGPDDELTVTAMGEVPGDDWTSPELSTRIYIKPPEDGLLDLEFTTSAPETTGLPRLCQISASVAVPLRSWLRGVRVLSATNSMEAFFSQDQTRVREETFRTWPWLV